MRRPAFVMRAAAAALFIALLAGCDRPPEVVKQESYVFGTRVEITAYADDPARARGAINDVLAALDRWHRQLHAWAPDSEVSAANLAIRRGEAFRASPELDELLRAGQTLSAQADGWFNPSIGGLVALWGFHADRYANRLPEAATLAAAVARQPRMTDLSWQAGYWRSRNPAVQLDFGGMAKGWALDKARQQLLKAGIRSALLNIGGNVMAIGQKPDGQPWQVGIRHPRQPTAMLSLPLADGEAIGTSGDYQRFLEVGGRRYCHLIDPNTGSAACTTQAVSVISRAGPHAGLISDVASKPVYFAPASEAARYARRFDLAGWLVVDGRGEIWLPAALAKRVQWLLPPSRLHTSG